ncbi:MULTISPECIES: hypothetical protein [Nocardia]|jgi:hypothetical protein|uniref:hypothetical protein n=1 Tax=Nocardia TaxID=1817 RepID=UPI00245442D5|nr:MULTISPECIES: hypothetical protein [Nocardia]
MARYTDHDQLAAEALQIAEDVRELGSLGVYRRLAAQCFRDPERMAQVIMCLSAWLDPETPVGTLIARAEAITEARAPMPRAVVA